EAGRPPRGPAMFRSLAVRNYRLFAMGQVVSNTGTWMQRVAQDWLVLQISGGSGIALGITTALQFLPMLLLGLWGGTLVDRANKRRLLIATQAAMGVLALGLGVLATAGHAEVWHVYLFAFGLGLVTVLDNPARQTFVVEMVGRRDLPNAIALNSASFQLGRVVGPAVAGLLIAAVGSGPVFLINAFSFLAVLTGMWMMRPGELQPTEPAPRAKGQTMEGLRYVAGRPELMLLLVMTAFLQMFGSNVQNQIALMTNNVFTAGAAAFGVAAAALAVGALAGALLSARRERPRRPRAARPRGPLPRARARAARRARARGGAARAAAPAGAAAPPAPGGAGAPPKPATLIGQVQLRGAGQTASKPIGRTPDNDI